MCYQEGHTHQRSNHLDPADELFKTTTKKQYSPSIDVNKKPRNILERHAKAIVVKKTKDNTDQADLKNKLIVVVTRISLGGISAVGRSKVDKKITAEEDIDVLMVLFHLEQTASLHDAQMMKFALIEMDKEYTIELVLETRRLSDVMCDVKLEVASRAMVSIAKTGKQVLHKSMIEQVLIMNKMSN